MSVPLLITDGDLLYFIAGDISVIDCTFKIKRFSVIDYAIQYTDYRSCPVHTRVNCDAKPQVKGYIKVIHRFSQQTS